MARKKAEAPKKPKTLRLGNYECPACHWIGKEPKLVAGMDKCPTCGYIVYPTDKV